MGLFADAVRADMDALIRDMQRPLWVSEECSFLRQVLNFLAEPIYTKQRKIMSRIRITGEIMDDFSLDKYAGDAGLGSTNIQTARMAQMPTLKDRINNAVVHAQDRLKQVREAQDIFERNPDLEKLLNIMQRNHF